MFHGAHEAAGSLLKKWKKKFSGAILTAGWRTAERPKKRRENREENEGRSMPSSRPMESSVEYNKNRINNIKENDG